MQPAICVTGLTKEYRITGEKRADTLYELLSSGLRLGRQAHRRADKTFVALHDVSFNILPGEVVGIVGRNGAGKSTLLKILSRITAPTRGRVKVYGRLASLLEVGTGFHPELSGRENIFLNGAILGMRRSDVLRRFDEIVAFAEIEKFVDTPVKRYSSGMYVRLAFAVAAHLEPDILVVDEVLAVGDAAFQSKCLGKMKEVRGNGRTVLVVSHNMTQLRRICHSAIWLDEGKVCATGDFETVASAYHASGAGRATIWRPHKQTSYFSFESVSIEGAAGTDNDSLSASQAFEIVSAFEVHEPSISCRLALHISDAQGQVVLASASTDARGVGAERWERGHHRLCCQIPGHLLSPGQYNLTVSQPTPNGDMVHENICSFTIDSADSLRSIDDRPGVIAPLLLWRRVSS